MYHIKFVQLIHLKQLIEKKIERMEMKCCVRFFFSLVTITDNETRANLLTMKCHFIRTCEKSTKRISTFESIVRACGDICGGVFIKLYNEKLKFHTSYATFIDFWLFFSYLLSRNRITTQINISISSIRVLLSKNSYMN